jgi:hypothetical protein
VPTLTPARFAMRVVVAASAPSRATT